MPQPVDAHTELARIALSERMQALTDRAAVAQQARTTDEVQQSRVESERQIEETPDTQSEHVDGDGKRKNPFAGRRRRRSKDESGSKDGKVFYHADERTEVLTDDDDHNLDVSV